VVEEWVLPRDLASVRRPLALTLDRDYDSWLALRRDVSTDRLRIVFLHNGDVFERNAAPTAIQDREQRIALRAVGPHPSVRWSANGVPLAIDANGTAFFPVRLGTWTIEAGDGRALDRVTIRVVPARHDAQPGFTVTKPGDCSRCRR